MSPGFRIERCERCRRVMMNARPSSIGEMLDRAIAIYLPRSLPLFIILAVVALPIAFIQSAASPGFTHTVDLFQQLVKVPPGHTAETQRIMRDFSATSSGTSGTLLLIYFAQGVLTALAMTALAVFSAAVIDGAPMSIVAAYRIALRLWVRQIVVGCAYVMFMIGVAIVWLIVVFIGALAIAGLNLIAPIVATIAGLIGGIVLAIVFVLAFGLLTLAWTMATISLATEEPNPFRAIGRGLRRTLVRPLLRRTLGAGAAALALVWFGTFVLLAFGGGLALLTRLDIVTVVIAAAGGVVINGLTVIFVMLYMRDVKLRREGSDLLAAVGEEPLPV